MRCAGARVSQGATASSAGRGRLCGSSSRSAHALVRRSGRRRGLCPVSALLRGEIDGDRDIVVAKSVKEGVQIVNFGRGAAAGSAAGSGRCGLRALGPLIAAAAAGDGGGGRLC